MNKTHLVLATLLFGALVCQRATCDPDLVEFPSGPASWTVDITPSPSQGGSASGRHLSKMEVYQDDQKRRTVLTMSDGVTGERWSIPTTNMILVEAPDGSVFGVSGDQATIYGLDYFESAFSWLKPSSLVEKDPISYQGKQCFHYKGTAHRRTSDLQEPTTFKAETWIDSKTLLPVAFDDGTWLATFTFHPPPFPPLTVPPKFQKTFDRLSR